MLKLLRVALALLLLATAILEGLASPPQHTLISANCQWVGSPATKFYCADDLPTFLLDIETPANGVSPETAFIQARATVPCDVVKKRGLSRHTIVCTMPSSGSYQLSVQFQDGESVQWLLLVAASSNPSESFVQPRREAEPLAGSVLEQSCQNGYLDENGLCQCNSFYSGEDCSRPCPGLRVSDCSDDGCYGSASTQCGDTCSWSSILNICIGANSCLEHVCSGQGICNWGREADASCSCALNYYGRTCETKCSTSACRDDYAIQDIQCSNEGACICSGNYGTLSSLCTDCKPGWYGTDCLSKCPCSDHGSCDQLAGTCSCFADEQRGYWTGSNCAMCKDGFTGRECREKNLILGNGVSLSMTLPDHVVTSVSPGASVLLRQSAMYFNVGIGSSIGRCTPTAAQPACTQATVNGTVWDGVERGSYITYLTLEPSVDSVTVRQVNETRDEAMIITEVNMWSLTPLTGGQTIVAAKLLANFGWFIVLNDGSIATETSLSFHQPPSNISFSAHDVAVNETEDMLCIAGAESDSWKLLLFSFTEQSFVGAAAASTLPALEHYTSAAAAAFLDDQSLVIVLVNDTSVAFTSVTVSPDWSLNWVLTDLKTESFSYATLRVGIDHVLYLIAHTASGVRVHTAEWLERRVTSTQLITDGVQPDAPWQPFVSLFPHPGVLLLTSQNAVSGDIEIRGYGAFAVKAVSPPIIDRSGGTTLTVAGHSFVSTDQCSFSDGAVSAVTITNTTTLSCVVPFLKAEKIFSSYAVEVRVSVPWLCADCAVVSNNTVTLLGFATPAPTRAYGSNNESYTSIYSTDPITVECLGAPNLDTLLCRFEDDAGMRVLSKATFVSSELVICEMPKISRPSSGTSGTAAISIDGSVFSPPTPFTFVGDASALTLASAASVAVAAKDRITFPTVLIRVVDNESHPLFELDRTRVVTAMALWFNSTRKELDVFISAYQSVVLSTYSNQTKVGETSFGVSLQYPRVGVGRLAFSSAGLEQTVIDFSVSEGRPASMSLAVEPESRIDNIHSTQSRQPVIIFRDVAENTVYNLQDPDASVNQVAVSYYRGTSTDTTQAMRNSNGYFEFVDVYPSGLFGRTYELVFSSPGFTNLTSSKVSMADCYPDQYAMYGTTYCLPCPEKAICNGSYSFNLTDGVWKGGELAYTVFECPLEEACIKGQCATGYSGPLCAMCSKGYGKSGLLCNRCYSVGANVVIVVFLVLMYLAFLFGLVVLLHQMGGPHSRAMQTLVVMLNFLQIVAVVLYPLTELPLYLNEFSTFLKVLGFCNVLRLSTLTCLGLNGYSAFIVALVAPFAAVPIFRAVLWEADKINNRHFRKLEEERRILRGFIPYESPEAYYSRVTFLGLDDEPAFRNENTSSTEKLEIQKGRIRQAYALLDKNSAAFATISQMAHSKARETALHTLMEEREDLLTLLRHYEGFISHGSRGGRGLKQTSSFSQSQLQQQGVFGMGGSAGRAPGELNDTVTDLEITRASGLSVVSHGTAGSRGEREDQANMTKDHDGNHTSVDGLPGIANGQDALLLRFPELTTTQLTLFGEKESFSPIRQNTYFSKEFDMEEERNVARVVRRVSAGVSFVWPSMPHKTLFLLVTFTCYLFNPVIANSFALVRCKNINYGIMSRDNTREEERSVLGADYSIACGTNTHKAYRFAGITIGSIYGGGFVLLIFFVFLTKRKHDRLARFFGYTFGLRPERGWWAGVMVLERFGLVIVSILVGGHLGAIVSFWILLVLLLVFMQVQPMLSSFLHRAEVVSRTISIIVASLQLLPFLNSTNKYDAATATSGAVCGAFILVVVCGGIAGYLGLAFMELVSPSGLRQLFVRCMKRLEYAKTFQDDAADGGDARGNTSDALEVCPDGAPFSFEMYNAALVSEHLRHAERASQERHGLLDQQMNALLRQRSSSLSGHSKTMTSVWLAGVAAMGAVSNVELLADFIDNSEAYVEKPKELQRDFQKYRTDPFASIRNLEKEMAWEHLVLLEHAQQLDSVVSRLTQIAHTGPAAGASMSKRVQ